MEDLLEAITIMSKYTDEKYPTNCDHDVMYFNTVEADIVTTEDLKRLEELGFKVDDELNCLYSYKFGSN